jgi:glycosyltransferase involved in cell wall biosynthesis
MASGCPVVALARGGALETVGRGADAATLARVRAGGVARVPGGVLFGTPTVEGLTEALRLLDGERFAPDTLRAQALPFDAPAFDRRFRSAFDRAYGAWKVAQRAGSGAA